MQEEKGSVVEIQATRTTKDKALSQREQAFLDAYLGFAKGNGAAAVREAGYETKNADVYSARLLAKPRIRTEIRQRREQIRREADVTAQGVIATLAAQMRGDITEMMDLSGQIDLKVVRRKKIGRLIKAIEFVSLKETRNVNGKRVSTTRRVVRRIELVSQQRAAIQLCKVLGIGQQGKNLCDMAKLRAELDSRVAFGIEGFRRGGITLTRRDVLEMFAGMTPVSAANVMPLIKKELAETGLRIQVTGTTRDKELSLRGEAFVEAYVVSVTGNGAAAVREAGYEIKNADVYAARLLGRANISKAIEDRREQLRTGSLITPTEVIATLAAQMHGDVTELIAPSGQFDPGVVRNRKLGGLIKVIEFESQKEAHQVNGSTVSTTREVVRRIEVLSQQQAAIQLCKVLGIERRAGKNENDRETLRTLLDERIAFATEGFARGGIDLTRRELLEMCVHAESFGDVLALIQEELASITQVQVVQKSERSIETSSAMESSRP